MQGRIVLLDLTGWITSPFAYVVVILFGVEVLTPRAWVAAEGFWWRVALGNSTAGQVLRRKAMKDFILSIDQKVIDSSAPRPLAVLLTILSRPFEVRRLTGDLRCEKNEMLREIYESAIEQLNAGWREGKDPQILRGYIKIIEESAGDAAIGRLAKLRGRSAVAVVKYALGDLVQANELGARNWAEAQELEPEKESRLKWIASYGYFNSTLFLGGFKDAMRLMATQWSKYYEPLDEGEKERLRESLSGHLILNPILAIPRHIILAAAFNEQPFFEPKYWPSREAYDRLTEKERGCKLRWVEAWYEEAKRICPRESTSLSFSHAYAGFYFTLLLLEPEMPRDYLHDKINEAFSRIDDSAALVAQYVRFGFRGVYHLVCGEDEKALESLSRAARLSAMSGNRFADCVFECAHAVAAARLNRPSRYLVPDINHYLSEANRLARKIKRPFYNHLYDGAQSAVCLLRGEKAKARKHAARSRNGETGNRILKIFFRDGEDPGA